MIIQIHDALDQATVGALREACAEAGFEDGHNTAGWAAREVKNNQQLPPVEAEAEAMIRMVEQRLRQHALFNSAARPARLLKVLISRYQAGMAYGTHVDNARMGDGRSDLSFTIGLTPRSSYQGGELVIEDHSGERAWQLDAGEMLLYPSTFLHRVNAVSDGQRLAVVGWLQSRVRAAEQREILFDLDQALHEVHQQQGKSHSFDLLSKCSNNLQRLWSE